MSSTDAPPDQRPSTLGRLVSLPISAVFAGLSAIRRNRIFHPVGRLYDGEFHAFPGDDVPAVPLFREPGPYPAAARLSRGIGLPAPLPDVLGLSVKLIGAHGPGADQDFLMASAGTGLVGRRVLWPGTDFLEQHFSSVLPYRMADETLFVGARPSADVEVDGIGFAEADRAAEEGVLQYEIQVAPPFGEWRRVGALLLRERVDGADLSFNPWTTGGGIRPVGPVNAVRDVVYRASQAARPDTPAGQEPDGIV